MQNESLTNSLPKASTGGRYRRKLQNVFTVLIGLIGAGMVIGAWFSIGHIRGEAVVNLAILGIVIPACIYAMLAVRGWHDTVIAGGELGRFATWCTRTKMNQVVPAAGLILILSLANNLNRALDRPLASNSPASESSSDDGFDVGMRRECLSSGVASLGAAAAGPQGALLHHRVQGYCDCVASHLEATYSIAELNGMAGDHDRISHDPKVQGAVAECQREAAR